MTALRKDPAPRSLATAGACSLCVALSPALTGQWLAGSPSRIPIVAEDQSAPDDTGPATAENGQEGPPVWFAGHGADIPVSDRHAAAEVAGHGSSGSTGRVAILDLAPKNGPPVGPLPRSREW
jgi:hypothetical protein